MNRIQSEHLDILLKNLIKPEYVGVSGLVNLHKMCGKSTDLKQFDIEYINSLLYIIKREQMKMPDLVLGDFMLTVYESSIKNFLKYGGFKLLYKKRKNKKRKDFFRFWSIFIISFITLGIIVWNNFVKSNISEKSKVKKELLIGKGVLTLPKTSEKDSLKYHYPKSNHQNELIDSLK